MIDVVVFPPEGRRGPCYGGDHGDADRGHVDIGLAQGKRFLCGVRDVHIAVVLVDDRRGAVPVREGPGDIAARRESAPRDLFGVGAVQRMGLVAEVARKGLRGGVVEVVCRVQALVQSMREGESRAVGRRSVLRPCTCKYIVRFLGIPEVVVTSEANRSSREETSSIARST